MVHAQATRILTQPTANGKLSAVGAEFMVGDKVYVANAAEEVILSAGYMLFLSRVSVLMLAVVIVAP